METDEKNPFGVLHADCLEAMRKMPDDCIDAIVTDPPYGINFMNKKWDSPGGMVGQMSTGKEKRGGFAYGGSHSRGYKDCDSFKFQEYMTPVFQEMLRIAKPGAHLLAFGGTRTYHRLACAIEDAGWEVRDTIMWLYGQGFPKSMDISKAIDKKKTGDVEEAKKWRGWGTCLKPAYEPVIMARKPLEGTVVDTVLKYGTGGINIDDCRVPTGDNLNGGAYCKDGHREKGLYGQDRDAKGSGMFAEGKTCDTEFKQPSGRFPANIIHDGSDEVVELFPDNVKGGSWNTTKGARHFNNNGEKTDFENHGSDNSIGSAARFFYCAKASKSEKGKDNPHPTVKPVELMKYLIRMVAPKGALVLDPFMGSGSTGVAAIQIGRNFIGIEKEGEYFNYAKKRIEDALQNK